MINKLRGYLYLIFEIMKETALFMLFYPISFFLRMKEIIIIGERPDEAKDNGFFFFKYMCDQHPEYKTYYVIDRGSADLEKIRSVAPDRIIFHRTIKHYLYYLAAKLKISTHIAGASPNRMIYNRFANVNFYGKRVFLQHGITKDNLPTLYYNRNEHLHLFCTGALPEYNYIKANFGYPENVVKLTGLARYDYLLDENTNNDSILIMPTWRVYCNGLTDTEFMKTSYFQHWNSILHNAQLISYLKETGKKIIFYPHSEVQKYVDCFSDISDSIVIGKDYEYDIQGLLKSSAMLITDYSSVFFDFAYMKKTMAYYQFDKDEFRKQHYQKGYFDYERDGFGPVFYEENSLARYICEMIDENFINEAEYVTRASEFFVNCDQNNCARIFDAIKDVL